MAEGPGKGSPELKGTFRLMTMKRTEDTVDPGGAGADNKPRFLTGWEFLFHRFSFILGCFKYLLNRRDYPLFRAGYWNGGYLRTLVIQRKLGMLKLIEFNGSYYSTLAVPHFPSKAFDEAVARGGLNFAAAGTPLKPRCDYVILGITPRCPHRCSHCYEYHNLGEEEIIPLARWQEVLRELQDIGVSTIVLSGGEPMMRFDELLKLLESGDKNRSDFHLHTSGSGITPERARELKKAGLTSAAVGLDDVVPERHDRLRGNGTFANAVDALRIFNQAGIFTYVNLCVTGDLIRSGDLFRYMDFVRSLNVGLVELLEPRPVGSFAKSGDSILLSEADRRVLAEFVRTFNTGRAYRGYPLIYYVADMESPGNLGCLMGGLSHFSVDSRGNVTPCVFMPVSFGSIREESLRAIFTRMREHIPIPVRTECPSLRIRQFMESSGSGTPIPVPFEKIRTVWKEMLYNGSQGM